MLNLTCPLLCDVNLRPGLVQEEQNDAAGDADDDANVQGDQQAAEERHHRGKEVHS